MINNKRIVILFIVLIIISALGLYHISLKSKLPCEFKSNKSPLEITNTSDPDLIPLIGYNLISINDHSVKSIEEIEVILDSFLPGDSVKLFIRKGDASKETVLRLEKFYSPIYLIIVSFTAFVFYLISVLVRIRRPDLKSARILSNAFIGAAIIITTTWGYYKLQPLYLGYFIRTVFSAAYVLSPVIFLNFTFSFPSDKSKQYRTIIITDYFLAIVLAIAQLVTFINAASDISIDAIRNYLFVFDICRVFMSANVLFGVAIFLKSYLSTKNEIEKKKLRWIFLGTAIGLSGYIFLWVIPQAITAKGLVPEEIILMLIIPIPVTFSIAIIRYHLLDIDFIIRRSITYLIALLLLILFYVLIVSGISYFISGQIIVSVITAIIVALLFNPARIFIQGLVDRKFFRIQYNIHEEQKKFIEEIKNANSLKILAEKLIERINQLIPVNKIGYFEILEGGRLRPLASDNMEEYLGSIKNIYQNFSKNRELPAADRDLIEPEVETNELPAEYIKRGIALVFTIKSPEGKYYGCLFLGSKKSDQKFSAEDIDLLSSVSTVSGITIERIKLQEKYIEERLEREKAEELNRIKSLFVASVSHDLKSPITSIKLFADMLKSNTTLDETKKQKYWKIIDGETGRLTRLINNILDFSQLEKGTKKYNFHNENLNELVREVLDSMEYLFEMENIEVHFDPADRVLNIKADKDSLIQAITNLISNAVKYSDKEKIIFIKTFIDNNFACISIEDKGIGIPEDELNIITEPFYRSSNVQNHSATGAGLGLSIVKNIVDAHSGEIVIESKVGSGSKFTLKFPMNN